MVSVIEAPESVCLALAERVRSRRLAQQLTQKGLAARAGVAYGTLKKFERTGRISLESLLKLALVLDALDEFSLLFQAKPAQPQTLEALLEEKSTRQRGSIN